MADAITDLSNYMRAAERVIADTHSTTFGRIFYTTTPTQRKIAAAWLVAYIVRVEAQLRVDEYRDMIEDTNPQLSSNGKD